MISVAPPKPRTIQMYDEIDLPSDVKQQLRPLLEEAFPATFASRIYFKQCPHRRLIAFDERDVVGQAGLDDRAIRIGDHVFGISGLIDLCVRPDRRREGIASALIQKAEARAREGAVPFMVLMADCHELYTRLGFERIRPAVTTWLAIEDRASISLMERDLSDCFMVKALTATPWPKGSIDLLGYLF